MSDNPKNRQRFDDAESRSKAELLDELALNKGETDQRIAHLLSELQVHQAELEMQNRELREAQETLEETRDRYAALYDFAPVGYLSLDKAGHILEMNLTSASMLGMERGNMIGKPFSTRLVNGDMYAFFHHLQQTFQSPGNKVAELKIVNREGQVSYVRLESAAVLNEPDVCRTVMTNISEQKRIAMELQQARTEQEALLAAIPAFVFYKDMNLRYVAVSQMLANFLGRPVADVLGRTDFELFPHELAEDFQRRCREVIGSGVMKSGIESRLADIDGNAMDLSIVVSPFFNPAGKIAGVLGVGLDISRLKRSANLNQELIQQNRTLMQNFFSIQENERRHLARELHDELGQWLTAIHAEAQAISSMIDKQHKISASAAAISESASEMHKVIHNMLRELRPALLDELGLADSVCELVNQWKIHHPGVASELLLEGNLAGLGEIINITVYRIIQEALSNIAKHAEAERVSVRLSRTAGDEAESDYLLLQVEDNGKGLDSEQLTKGFGLLGMRERAIAAYGEFILSNTPGVGVKIEIRLPISRKIESGN